MGRDSDLPIMSKAAELLDKFGIEYEVTVVSARRMPDVVFDYAKQKISYDRIMKRNRNSERNMEMTTLNEFNKFYDELYAKL